MLGIPGFKPHFYSDAKAFKTAHQDALKAAIGFPIQAYYLQWEMDDDTWNRDAPLIFIIREQQYEFCAYKMSDFHLSINQIDRNIPLNWYGSNDEFPLLWKKSPLDQLNPLLDKKIEKIRLVEWLGLLVGIQFFLSTSPFPLCILNALDENSILLQDLDDVDYNFIDI
jgi:hypothetical protein